jgi:acetylornithine deacetylase/succinyl-diaminopimelate desuccinylase-like protein
MHEIRKNAARLRRRAVALPASLLAALCLIAGAAVPVRASGIDWAEIGTEAATFLSEYIRIDTTNPPGNEMPAAEFLASRFHGAGLEAKVFQSESGRGSVLARLRGSGARRPVVLLNHLDVVPADPAGWAHPPFAGAIDSGYVYGRGAIDCKGIGVVEAMALIAMKRAGTELSRDVIFLGTADEEEGGAQGAGWFVDSHFDELGDPEFVLNEGGAIRQDPDGRRVYEVGVAEKTPFWLRLIATGEGGHGSTPRPNSAVTRLIRALDRIDRLEPRVRVIPEVQRYYRALAGLHAGETRERYRDLRAALRDPAFRTEFLAQPRDAALVRDTIAPTVLRGSAKTNVVPRTASAEFDCRLLPGDDPQAFLDHLKATVGDDGVRFEVLLSFPSSSSDVGTALYRAIAAQAREHDRPVVPSVLRGFTDSHFFRERGVVAYGFVPVVITREEGETLHGIDERMSLENLRDGPRRLVEILQAVGGERGVTSDR